jgi:integrase
MRGSIVKPTAQNRRRSWGVVIPMGVDSQTGNLKQQWKGGFRTRADAVAYLNEVLPQVQNGTYTAPTKERFSTFVQRWLRDYARATVRETTLSSYAMIVHKHLIPELGLIPLTQLSPKRIQQYFTKKLDAGLSSTTVRHHAMLLHRLLAAAVREGVLSQNPADRVEVPRSRVVELKTLDIERAKLFLAAARRNSPLYPLYFAALFLGLRMGELLGLAWKHVSFALARASVVQIVYWLYGSSKEGRSTQLLFKEPKSRQSRREVSLPPLLVEELRRLREAQQENRRLLDDGYHDYDLIFCQANGKPLHPSDVRKDFHRILKAAGLPRIRFHDLRHSCATLRLAAGDNLKIVQELLGHASAAFPLSVYGHVVPGLQEQSTRALEARLLGEKPEVHEQS